MDDAGDRNQAATVLGLLDVVVPLHDGQRFEGYAPVELGALLVDLLLELLDAALFDLVGAELFEVVGEAEFLHGEDEPLGRVVLPPLDGVAVIGGEFCGTLG